MSVKNCKFISIFDFKDEKNKEKFLKFAYSENGIKVTRKYKGCISINVYNSKNNPICHFSVLPAYLLLT